MTQAGTICERAWAPMQPIRDLGNGLTMSQWVVTGFSNLELTCWSLGVGRICADSAISFGRDREHLALLRIRSGTPDFWLLICDVSTGDVHPEPR